MNRINSKKNNRKEAKKLNQEKSENKRFSFFKLIVKILFIIVLVLGICSGIFYYKIQENGGGLKGALMTILNISPEDINNLDTINILLLGISDDLDSTLTDTIMVCSYNPQKQSAYMLSIPRDTFIGKNKSNAKGSDKINALYAKSPEKLLKKVTEITGIDLKYYAVVNNQALIDIVDIIGGINFEVPIDMDYDDPTQDLHIHLKKGLQKIDGEKAEQLLRFRHNNDGSSYPSEYGDNDFGRMRTQREFISATIKQTLVVKNLPRAKKIINSVFENIETNINLDTILPYIPDAIDFNTENIVSERLPGASEKLNNLLFYIYDKTETKRLINELN